MKKQEVISQVQNSLGSLFTKDDVVNCLNMVVEESKVETQPTDFQAVLNLIKDRVVNVVNEFSWDDSDNIDITDTSFRIDYDNRVELDSFDVDASAQRREMIDQLRDLFNELEEDHQTRLEIVAEQQEVVQEN
jgi:hypothetical protein